MDELEEDPLAVRVSMARRAMNCGAACAQVTCRLPRVAAVLRVPRARTIIACMALGVSGSAFCATAAPPANGPAPGLAPESATFRQAAERERDAETLQTLTAEGRLLLSRDRVALPAYDYCSMAVSAAERGDFRDSVEAAARALVVAQRTDNADLAALSKRDLAIAYSYAGDLDDAERYATEALASIAEIAGAGLRSLQQGARRRRLAARSSAGSPRVIQPGAGDGVGAL